MCAINCAECGVGLPAVAGRGRPRRYCSRRCQARAYRRRRDHGPTTSPRRSAAPPTPDGRDPVALAVELADSLGLENVSMRLLADRAGLPAHRLYRRARNRGDLLSAMAEHVISARRPRPAGSPAGREVRPDEPRAQHDDPRAQQDGPRAQLEDLARDEWAMYRRHPWLLAVLATDRPPTGPAVFAMVDRVVSVLATTGLDATEAYRSYLVLSGYIQGMALLIPRRPAETEYRTWLSATSRRLERTGRLRERPWLTAASQTNPDTDLDAWFEFGLRRMLDGLLGGAADPLPVRPGLHPPA